MSLRAAYIILLVVSESRGFRPRPAAAGRRRPGVGRPTPRARPWLHAPSCPAPRRQPHRRQPPLQIEVLQPGDGRVDRHAAAAAAAAAARPRPRRRGGGRWGGVRRHRHPPRCGGLGGGASGGAPLMMRLGGGRRRREVRRERRRLEQLVHLLVQQTVHHLANRGRHVLHTRTTDDG